MKAFLSSSEEKKIIFQSVFIPDFVVVFQEIESFK